MLQEKRQAAGLSQSQLAQKSGVNLRMIQHYEQGFRDINGAKLETLLDLSAAIGCSIRDILTNEILKEKCENGIL